ncbi:lambda-exonuclease family protein [Nocardia sp. NPDC050435]|uniref:YqaJ viral recombinase family nuclease n=1 Tax=Nocardia sp. NPDC050435 TaxID=3155040 RepID=UPI0033D98CF8
MSPASVNDALLLGSYPAGSPEWHAARANGIGGSEIAAVVGLSPWESRYSLWHRKKDRLRPVTETGPMKWGTLLEPVVFEEFRAHHLPAGHTMTTGATYQHKLRTWQIANPDGLIWSPSGELVDGVEIKCPGEDFSEKWPREGSDNIPIYYRCQIAWYCSVLGLDSMILRALIGGNDARTYRIRPSTEDLEYLISEGAQFWAELEADVLPNLDGHTATYQAVRELHPDIDRSVIAQIPAALADRWWAVQDAAADAEAELIKVRIEIADAMGSAWKAASGEQAVAYRIRPWKNPFGDPYVKSAPRPKDAATESLAQAAA